MNENDLLSIEFDNITKAVTLIFDDPAKIDLKEIVTYVDETAPRAHRILVFVESALEHHLVKNIDDGWVVIVETDQHDI